MKKILPGGLGAVWVILSATGVIAAEPVNLLSNGGFEAGLAGWNADPGHSVATAAGVARSGKACLTGEVTAPKQALRLRRSVPVKAGNRYQFQVAARATGGTKLVLWAVFPGQRERKMVAAWEKITPKWQEYASPLPVAQDGLLELEIIAPSSHAAPPGRIWIDDVALLETPMPAVLSVSRDEGFNDEPAIAQAGDGSIYVAWNSFREGADSLQIARYRPQEKDLAPAGRWQVLGGKGTYVLGVRAVPTGEKIAVLYAAEKEKKWDVYCVLCGPDGPAQPVAVTSDAAADVNPAAAWDRGTLWIAWESNRSGVHQVFLSGLAGGKLSEPIALTPPDCSCYNPSVAVLQSGVLCVAWHSFRENNYDVYLRRRAADGSWGPETRLTRAATIDRHPVLAARGDELWLVYENAQVARYHIGATNFRRLIVAKVEAEGLCVPKDDGGSPLAGRCESPSPAFDSSGRLWLAYLRPRLPRAGWDTVLTCLDGTRWQVPAPVFSQKGMDRRPGLVLDSRRAIVAGQVDDVPNGWSDVDRTLEAKSNVVLAVISLDPAAQAAAPRLVPAVEPADTFEAAEIRVARGEDAPTPAINYQGRPLRLFFGDLHHHSDISVCNRCGDQSVEEGYQHMRDISRLDFACATDHCYNINPYLWSYLGKLARVNDAGGRFLTFLAEEWTSSFEEYSAKHPYGFYGHRNLVFGDTYFPRWWNSRNRQTPAEVWEELRKLNADFIHIPHQLADTGNVPTDWDFTDEKAQPVAEIFQTRGSYEHHAAPRQAARATPPGYFIQDAWARGIVIGVIASPDHGGGYGKACVFAPELSRRAILDALRARHCYGTSAAKIFLDVRVNGRLMGEKIAEPATAPVTVQVAARCPGEIDRVEVCRNNRFVYAKRPPGRDVELTFVDREPLAGRSYYYVRVIQKDEEIAWSSPVWFGAK